MYKNNDVLKLMMYSQTYFPNPISTILIDQFSANGEKLRNLQPVAAFLTLCVVVFTVNLMHGISLYHSLTAFQTAIAYNFVATIMLPKMVNYDYLTATWVPVLSVRVSEWVVNIVLRRFLLNQGNMSYDDIINPF